MGSICPQVQASNNSPQQQSKSKSPKSTITEQHHVDNIGGGHSDLYGKDLSFTSKQYIRNDNSFNRNNEIGPYFCGGSILERDAMSYKQRMQEFEGIMKKSDRNKKKQSKRDKNNDSAIMNNDMERTFTKKFKNLPILKVNPKDLQKCIKKGPPIKYRWVSWKTHLFAISELNLESTTELYKQFQYFSKEEVQIEKDINRTFPSQKYFATNILKNNMRDHESINGYEPLKKVLISISNMYPELGYCQGMNFILGFILMINGANEPEAFWTFKILAEHPDFMLMGLYETGLPLLKLLEYVSKKILKEHCKDLMDYFDQLDIPDSFWLTKWILTLFLYNFPVKICSRLWDYLITNDIFSLIKLFIPLLDLFKKEFMSNHDACDFMETFTSLTQVESNLTDPKSEFYMNITDIVKKADTYKIEKKTIAKYSKQYLNQEESDNEYAKLYSHYDSQKEFKAYHHKLIQAKVNNIPELTSVMEDRNEESSSNKQDILQKKSLIDASDSTQTTSNSKIQNDKDIKDIPSTNNLRQISESKFINESEDKITNLNTTIDLVSKISISQKLQQQEDKKQQLNDGSSMSENTDIQNNNNNNICSSNTETPIHRPTSQLRNLKLQQENENPENSFHINEEDEDQQNDSDDSEEYEELVDLQLSMRKTDSNNTNHHHNHTNIRRYTNKKNRSIMDEQQDAIAFDHESYNMFQSMMNKSIEVSMVKKQSPYFNKSLQEVDDYYEDVKIVQQEDDESNHVYCLRIPQINIVSSKSIQPGGFGQNSTLSSQCDLSKHDKLFDMNNINNNNNNNNNNKKPELFSSNLSDEKTIQSEIKSYQIS